MTSLRDELGGQPATATPYTLLCPPGWRRVPPAAIVDDARTSPVLAQFKSAGRPDLVMQFRAMLARYRAAIRQSQAFEAYLPPLIDDVPLPAAMLVSPFVLPETTTWDMALGRLARGSEVQTADFAETRMWVWRRDERVADESAAMVGRASHYLVPVPEDDPRRALHFHLTVLVADDESARALIDPLIALGDLMMSTMRWRNPS